MQAAGRGRPLYFTQGTATHHRGTMPHHPTTHAPLRRHHRRRTRRGHRDGHRPRSPWLARAAARRRDLPQRYPLHTPALVRRAARVRPPRRPRCDPGDRCAADHAHPPGLRRVQQRGRYPDRRWLPAAPQRAPRRPRRPPAGRRATRTRHHHPRGRHRHRAMLCKRGRRRRARQCARHRRALRRPRADRDRGRWAALDRRAPRGRGRV